MKTVGAAAFKAQCLSLLDRLDDEGLVVTKHGTPVARVVRYAESDGDLIGSLQGTIEVRGDVFSTGAHWNASASIECASLE